MDDELLRAMWPVFRAETGEHIESLTADVLKLELAPEQQPPGVIDSICRTAHSVKGSAASLGFHDIEQLAHVIEDAVLAVKRGHGPPRVAAILAALMGIDAALGRGDLGHAPDVPDLQALLADLEGESLADAPAPGALSPELELWPVFRLEVTEQVEVLASGLQQLQARGGIADHASEEVGRLTLAARQIHGSANLMGLKSLEGLALAVEQSLEGQRSQAGIPGDRLRQLADAVQALRSAVADVDRSGEGQVTDAGKRPVPAPVAPFLPAAPSRTVQPSVLEIFIAEARSDLAVLEGIVSRVRSPGEADRSALLEDARRRAHGLKGSAAALGLSEVARIAEDLQGSFEALARPDGHTPAIIVRIAGLLTDLRPALDAASEMGDHSPGDPGEVPGASPSKGAPAAPEVGPGGRVADRALRVSEKTLDSIALQVDDVVLSQGRQEQTVKELLSLGGRISETVQVLEKAVTELRMTGSAGNVHVQSALATLRSVRQDMVGQAKDAARDVQHLRLVSTVLRHDLHDLRMMPASTVLEPLRRAARDVAHRVGKQMSFRVHGGEIRLDRRILDELKDPLLHLVRNAIDHGLEDAPARATAKKGPVGNLETRVEQHGHRVAFVVEDDGAGLALGKIRATAVKRGLITSDEAGKLDDAEAARLIFRPGFSTADQVTAISGRGVGLDVVMETVSRLQGNVGIEFKPGLGTRFTLDLPLTLSATMALLVEVNRERVAIPSEFVSRLLHLGVGALGAVAGRAVAQVSGAQLPFGSLAQAMGMTQAPARRVERQPAVVLKALGQEVVLAVDDLVGHEEVVVQPLGRQAIKFPHLAGAAVVDGGTVVPVLNAPEIVRRVGPMGRPEQDRVRPRVLLVDDSLTTRSAMKALLEIGGYSVATATNGEEALAFLQEGNCQLIVSDVQMPRLDGLGLTRAVKSEPRWAQIPVILVTSLDSAEDRANGLRAGADGYLVKRDVERGKLLELVGQLMPRST